MTRKQKSLLLVFQLLIVGFFVFMAIASGETDRQFVRGAAQGGYCGANGFTLIGYYASQRECENACYSSGYSQACVGDATTACFCK